MIYFDKRNVIIVQYKRTFFSALSFILCIILLFSFCSCDKKTVSNVSSDITSIEVSSSIPIIESSSAASIEESSSNIVKQESTSSAAITNITSKTTSVAVNQGTVAQSGVFDVYASAEKWIYKIDKSKPVPLQPCIDNSFFNDVMFVGDSITTGIDLYDIVNGCSVIAYTGINTSTIKSKAVVRNKQGTKVTFLDAMKQYNPKHIFIMLGINGIAFQSKDVFLSGYRGFVGDVIAQHPDSIIYLQSILPVTNKKQNSDRRFANSKINSYNEGIQALATEMGVYYLNVAEAFKDAYGNLPSSASSDGIHFGPAHYRLWIEYIKRHTVFTGEIPEEPISSVSDSSQTETSTPSSSETSTSQPETSQPETSQFEQTPVETSSETSSKQVLISRPEREDTAASITLE